MRSLHAKKLTQTQQQNEKQALFKQPSFVFEPANSNVPFVDSDEYRDILPVEMLQTRIGILSRKRQTTRTNENKSLSWLPICQKILQPGQLSIIEAEQSSPVHSMLYQTMKLSLIHTPKKSVFFMQPRQCEVDIRLHRYAFPLSQMVLVDDISEAFIKKIERMLLKQNTTVAVIDLRKSEVTLTVKDLSDLQRLAHQYGVALYVISSKKMASNEKSHHIKLSYSKDEQWVVKHSSHQGWLKLPTY